MKLPSCFSYPINLVFCLLVFCSCSTLQVVEKGESYSIIQNRFWSHRGDSLEYSLLRFQDAKPGEKYPLLFVMHGSGQDGLTLLENWKAQALSRKFMVLAPTRKRRYLETPKFTDAFDLLLEDIQRRYPVDKDRIFLSGDSSGGLYVRKFLAQKPMRWRGVILISSPPASGEHWIDSLDVSSGFPPLLYIHGAKDNQFDIGLIGKDIESFKQKGADVEWIIDADAGHTHKQEWNEKVFEWIEQNQMQKKTNARS